MQKRYLLILLLLLTLSACNLGQPSTPSTPSMPSVKELKISPNKITMYSGEVKELNIIAVYDDGDEERIANDDVSVDASDIVLTDSKISATKSFETGKTHDIELSYQDIKSTIQLQIVSNPLQNYELDSNGKKIIIDPYRLDVIVNKDLSLRKQDMPENLIVPDIRWPHGYEGNHEKKHMRAEAASALEELFEAANEAGHKLYGVSGYRSYNLQERIFASNVKKYGSVEKANKISAKPGESEHHTGLVMDISGQSVGSNRLVESFGESPEGMWVAENCSDFGFIIRYLKGKEDITGYNYEPWHLRYLGPELAQAISETGKTMEEYFEEFLN